MFRRRGLFFSAAACVAIVLTSCGDDPIEPPQSLFAPEQWAGVWEITLTSRDCGDTTVIAVDVITDSVCTGSTLVEFLGLEGDVQLDCTGIWNETKLDAACSGHAQTVGCDTDIDGTIQALVDATSFSGTAHIDVLFDCDGDRSRDCVDAELSAIRLGPEPATCEAPPTKPRGGVLAILKHRLLEKHGLSR